MDGHDRKIELLSYLMPSGNPRVPKEAEALAAAGFEVTVVTSALPGSNRIRMPQSTAFRVNMLNRRSAWWGLWRHRLFQKFAPLWPPDMRAQVAAYGSLFVDLAGVLQASSRGVLRIAHLEPAFLAAGQAGCFRSMCCDFEDWYSEDLLPGRRSAELTVALRSSEQSALTDSLSCWCTSQAMASSLSATYEAPEPLVVRNVFPRQCRESIDGRWMDRPGMSGFVASNDPARARPVDAAVSFHWFSQTIGPGRGLEQVFEALDGVHGEWELHLRGSLGNYSPWLESVCAPGVRRRLSVYPLAATDELTSRIAEHDVGLACEARLPRSRDVTITNKLFQYLQAGLAVVASDTAGQREASLSAPGAVELHDAEDAGALRALLQQFVDDRDKLRVARSAAWEAGGHLCWENEAPRLVAAVTEAARRSRTMSRQVTPEQSC